MKKNSRLSFHTILPGLFCAFVLFVFAPVDMYLSTADELWFSLKDLIPWLLIFAVVTFAGDYPALLHPSEEAFCDFQGRRIRLLFSFVAAGKRADNRLRHPGRGKG